MEKKFNYPELHFISAYIQTNISTVEQQATTGSKTSCSLKLPWMSSSEVTRLKSEKQKQK